MMSVKCYKYAPIAEIFQIWLFCTSLLVVGVCSSGWSCYSSQCYYVSTVAVRGHLTARSDCQSANADLASISDAAENNFVTSIWSVY